MTRLVAGSASALMVSIGPADAQTIATPTIPFVVQQPAREWLASQFIGQVVTNQAGETVGEIKDQADRKIEEMRKDQPNPKL